MPVTFSKGNRFNALSGQIAGFASSRETAEQWVSCAETFFRDVLVSFYDHSGRLLIHREEIPLIRRCAASFSAEQMAEAAVCAEKSSERSGFQCQPGACDKIYDIRFTGKAERLKGESPAAGPRRNSGMSGFSGRKGIKKWLQW